MPALAAIALVLAAVPAPPPTPADAPAVLEEVRKPGASAVLVNVWATWCVPCREEFPDILRVAREYRERGLRLVLVSADFSDATADVTEFLTAQGVDFPTLLKAGKDEAFVDGLDRRWTGSIPASFLYDGRGKLVRYWEGKADYKTLEKRVRDALRAKEAP